MNPLTERAGAPAHSIQSPAQLSTRRRCSLSFRAKGVPRRWPATRLRQLRPASGWPAACAPAAGNPSRPGGPHPPGTVSAAGMRVRLRGHANQGHQSARAPGAPRQPGVNPHMQTHRQFSGVTDRDDQHIRFGCRLDRVRKDAGIRQFANLPGLMANTLVADQLPHPVPQFRGPVPGQGVLINRGDVQRRFGSRLAALCRLEPQGRSGSAR